MVVPMGKMSYPGEDRSKQDVDMKILKNQGVTEEDLKTYGGMDND